MNKTGQMIEFEEETGQSASVTVKVGFAELQFPSEVYVEWLEAELLKASVNTTAYDRLMSGGKKTLKEWADIFGMPVAIGKNRLGIVFDEIPELFRTVEAWRGEYGYTGIIPATLINYDGDWGDSLTLPDGWEDR